MISGHTSMHKPELNALQRAWLKEIGLDVRALQQMGFAQQPLPEQQLSQPSAPPRAGRHANHTTQPTARVQRSQPSRREASEQPVTAPLQTNPGQPTDQIDTLDALRQHAIECVRCGLHEVRGRVVFGEGQGRSPRWMFIGEAPGEYDDSTGRPFQGRAGELLQAMLAAADMDLGSAYFTNALKCRPVGNRLPDQAEINACLPWLHEQIRLLQPGCLIALGKVAAAALLGEAGDVA